MGRESEIRVSLGNEDACGASKIATWDRGGEAGFPPPFRAAGVRDPRSPCPVAWCARPVTQPGGGGGGSGDATPEEQGGLALSAPGNWGGGQ